MGSDEVRRELAVESVVLPNSILTRVLLPMLMLCEILRNCACKTGLRID